MIIDEKYIRKIFVKKLNYYMAINDKKQIDLINDLSKYGITRSTVSSWCTGRRMPGIEKIDLLAEYFNINRSDLLEDKKEETTTKVETIAAHHEGEDWTEEELKAIEDYKAFVRSKRNK